MTRLHQWLLLAAGLLLAPALLAQHEAHPDHVSVQKVESLDFYDVLAAAIEYAPTALEAPVRQQQAAAYAAVGKSWLAGRPAIQYLLYDDRLLDNAGQWEQEYGLQLPLRRPAELRLAREHGERYGQQVSAWEGSMQWQLAGGIRTALADLEQTETLLELQQISVTTAADVYAATQRLFEAGAVARLDLLQAENLLLVQQQILLEAEARLVDAERSYTVLTGLQQRPAAAHREQQSVREHVDEQHPLLRYLQSEVAVAASDVLQSEISNKGSPQLSIGSRRERGDRFDPYIDTVAISVNIPVGGANFVSSRTSTARREQVDAEVQLLGARRELQRLVHEAEHELYVTRQALPLAQQQAALGAERSAMARVAFDAGETNLAQVLLAVQDATQAQRDYLRLQLREQQLITEYNHHLGVLP
jgi:outer membrane protein, heavy metal efflux system